MHDPTASTRIVAKRYSSLSTAMDSERQSTLGVEEDGTVGDTAGQSSHVFI